MAKNKTRVQKNKSETRHKQRKTADARERTRRQKRALPKVNANVKAQPVKASSKPQRQHTSAGRNCGVGLSTDQGANAVDLMNSESAVHGQEARNALQLQLLENREMDDALSGLKFLRALPYVDVRNVAVIGHSFGGSLTVLLAEREPNCERW
jgi:Prolyl oligopeptidase family